MEMNDGLATIGDMGMRRRGGLWESSSNAVKGGYEVDGVAGHGQGWFRFHPFLLSSESVSVSPSFSIVCRLGSSLSARESVASHLSGWDSTVAVTEVPSDLSEVCAVTWCI